MPTVVAGTPLHVAYSFSFMRRGRHKEKTATNEEKKSPDEQKQESAQSASSTTTTASATPHPYENSIKAISTVKTVEQFWSTYNYLRRPNDLSSTTDYHFFRDGIKPTWEDPKNAKGGKWIIRLPKGLASRYWEEVILALIGGQFPNIPDGEICGLVISIRYSEDILGVWNRSANDRDVVDRLRDAIKKVLQLPTSAYASLEYKPHTNSIADRSSFRNAQTWKPSRQSSEASHITRHRSGSWVERESRRDSARASDGAWR